LFLPALLERESRDQRLKSPDQDRAYEIICKWADIESKGKLDPMKETNLEGEFCKDIFGDALGYTLFSEGKNQWNFQQKYFVNGGHADAAIGADGPPVPVAALDVGWPDRRATDRDLFALRQKLRQDFDLVLLLLDLSEELEVPLEPLLFLLKGLGGLLVLPDLRGGEALVDRVAFGFFMIEVKESPAALRTCRRSRRGVP
jgi:hypothetical protein